MLTGTFFPNFAYLYVDATEYFEYFQNPRTPTHAIVAATNPVPEPSMILILGAGFLCMVATRLRRRRTWQANDSGEASRAVSSRLGLRIQ